MVNKYSEVESSLNKILGKLDIEEKERLKYNEYLTQIIEYLENGKRNYQVFNELYRGKQYVGSSYENLRIDSPDEFDINFLLVIPKYIGYLEVCNCPDAGFCRLLLNEETCRPKPEKDDVKKVVKKWFNDDGYLRRSSVLQWMTSVVDKVFNQLDNLTLRVGDEKFVVRRSYSGPAVTLTVKPVSAPEHKFSIDLVPVFLFTTWPNDMFNIRHWISDMLYEEWCAVPKSKDENRDTSFRMSFWRQEYELLLNKYQLKPALKLLKKLRDVNNWKGLCSYYIKTIFLWKNDSSDQDFWKHKSKSEVFLGMLEELQDYLLNKGELPFYWNDEFDLWTKLKSDNKQNLGNWIGGMRKDVEIHLDEPNYIEKYFRKSSSDTALVPVTEEEPRQDGGWLMPALVGGAAVLAVTAAIGASVGATAEQPVRQDPRRRAQRGAGDSLIPMLVGASIEVARAAAVIAALATEPAANSQQLRRYRTRNNSDDNSDDDTDRDGRECSVM